MSLFRALNEAALAANLSKNEAKVFMTLTNQTIGYGKTFDHLTNKRLAQLAGIRQDRLHVAIEGVVEKGLFTVKTSTYYNFRYQISNTFLELFPIFFTPHIPKNRVNFQETERVSEIKNDPPNFGNIHNNTFTSFNLTSLTSQQAAIKPPIKKEPSVPEKVSGVVRILQNIAKKDQAIYLQAFSELSVRQQQRVLNVYENKEKVTIIYSPPKLLMALIKAEKDGRLILPEHISHASHKPFQSEEKTKQEKIDEDHFGKLTWLKDHAEADAIPLPELAEKMLMGVYLEDTHFVKFWLGCHAEQEGKTIEELAKRLMIDIDTGN